MRLMTELRRASATPLLESFYRDVEGFFHLGLFQLHESFFVDILRFVGKLSAVWLVLRYTLLETPERVDLLEERLVFHHLVQLL